MAGRTDGGHGTPVPFGWPLESSCRLLQKNDRVAAPRPMLGGTRHLASIVRCSRAFQAGLIGTTKPLPVSVFGIVIVISPFVNTASTFFSSTCDGRRTERTNAP